VRLAAYPPPRVEAGESMCLCVGNCGLGAQARDLKICDPRPTKAVLAEAARVLHMLGALGCDGTAITGHGPRVLAQMALHPRLAHMVA